MRKIIAQLFSSLDGVVEAPEATSLTELIWANSSLIRGEMAQALAAVKDGPGGDIVMTGSPRLVRSLLALPRRHSQEGAGARPGGDIQYRGARPHLHPCRGSGLSEVILAATAFILTALVVIVMPVHTTCAGLGLPALLVSSPAAFATPAHDRHRLPGWLALRSLRCGWHTAHTLSDPGTGQSR
jgi:hypothetical protein